MLSEYVVRFLIHGKCDIQQLKTKAEAEHMSIQTFLGLGTATTAGEGVKMALRNALVRRNVKEHVATPPEFVNTASTNPFYFGVSEPPTQTGNTDHVSPRPAFMNTASTKPFSFGGVSEPTTQTGQTPGRGTLGRSRSTSGTPLGTPHQGTSTPGRNRNNHCPKSPKTRTHSPYRRSPIRQKANQSAADRYGHVSRHRHNSEIENAHPNTGDDADEMIATMMTGVNLNDLEDSKKLLEIPLPIFVGELVTPAGFKRLLNKVLKCNPQIGDLTQTQKNCMAKDANQNFIDSINYQEKLRRGILSDTEDDLTDTRANLDCVAPRMTQRCNEIKNKFSELTNEKNQQIVKLKQELEAIEIEKQSALKQCKSDFSNESLELEREILDGENQVAKVKESLARELTLPKAKQFLIEKVTKLLLEIVEDHSSGNVDEKYIAEKEKVAAKLVETMQKFEDENTDELKHLVFEGIVFDQMQS